MNIVFVTNKQYPSARGSSGGLDGLRDELIKKGHRVFVIASKKGESENAEDGVHRFLVREYCKKRWVWDTKRVTETLDYLHPDVVHTQQYDGLGKVARLWAIRKGIPWVQTVSDLVSVEKARAVKEKPLLIITPAQTLESLLRQRYGTEQKIAVLPNGIDTELFSGADGSFMRKKWDIPEDARVLLSVSRVVQEKNSQFLFRALTSLLKAKENVYLFCVGGGDLIDFFQEEIVKRGLQERVFFVGQVPKKEMKHYYASADVFVYVSQEDFRATVVAEAMYMGLPVVAIQSGGAQERIIENQTGLVISQTNEDDAFSKAVEELLNDSETAKKFGNLGHEYAQSHYTNERCADTLLYVYNWMLT